MSEPMSVIPIAKPWMDEREVEAARNVILSGWVSQGPKVAAFENDFAETVGAKYACAVSSGTAALHLALLGVGVSPGDEVITVSHSFIATANSIRHCGATPIFVDIQRASFNINPTLIESAITPKTRALLCVHQMGLPCDMDAILKIAHRHDLPVVEDAACAIGSEILVNNRWEKIGKPHGDIACFSFHPRKIISTGDGGMLTTNHQKFDRKFRLWRQNGMSVPDTVRHNSKDVIFESYPEIGFNYRMTDIQAAIGCEQLKRLPEMIECRRYLSARYQEKLSKWGDLTLPQESTWARSNWQSYCVRLPEGCDQRQVMQRMLDRGVATRRGVMCTHRESAYQTQEQQRYLPESEKAQDQCILLPLYPQMSDLEQAQVMETFVMSFEQERMSKV